MSTEWLPLQQIKYDDFEKNLPSFLKIDQEHTKQYDRLVITDGISFIHCSRTHTDGLLLTQYGKNQVHYDIIEKIGEAFKTKFMSYIGEPYEDKEIQKYKYNDLFEREYPGILLRKQT